MLVGYVSIRQFNFSLKVISYTIASYNLLFVIPGTGVFSEIVSQESKRQPILLGKPGIAFGEFAMKRAGVTDASRVLFIGDM